MRLISWNVNRATEDRLGSLVDALTGRGPDIVAFQEVTRKGASQSRQALALAGLPHSIDSFELAPDQDPLKGPREFGLVLASRWPLQARPPSEFAVPWPERILSADVETPDGTVEVHTTHVPPGSTNGVIKVETLEGIYEGLSRPSRNPRVLCGDLNTPQLEKADGSTITWAQRLGPDGKVAGLSRGARWHEAEWNVLRRLKEHDLQDVYRALHGFAREAHSWFWKGRGRRIGRRFDHVFASSALQPRSCRYLHPFRARGLSDHSPIEADFSFADRP